MKSTTGKLALGIFGSILAQLDKSFTGFSDVVDAVTAGLETAKGQLSEFKSFQFDAKWRTRVISVPAAIDHSEKLWQTVRQGLLDKIVAIVDDINGTIQEIKNLPPPLPGEPILQRTALILSIVHAINEKLAQTVTEIFNFATIIDEIKRSIEKLEPIFLSQASLKKSGDFMYRKRQRASNGK